MNLASDIVNSDNDWQNFSQDYAPSQRIALLTALKPRLPGMIHCCPFTFAQFLTGHDNRDNAITTAEHDLIYETWAKSHQLFSLWP